MNESLAKLLPIDISQQRYDDPHTKAHLLFQAHFCRAELPVADYLTDTKSILDQAIRILQVLDGYIEMHRDEEKIKTGN